MATTNAPGTSTQATPAKAASSSPASTQSKVMDVIQPFIIGGLSGMFATCIIQPIDMIKVTIQLKSEEQVDHKKKISPFAVAREIYAAEGTKGFYRG